MTPPNDDLLTRPGRVDKSNYLTVKTLSERWGVSRSVVYQMVNDGLLPALRIGTGRGTIRVKEQDVVAFERERRRDDAKEVAEHFN